MVVMAEPLRYNGLYEDLLALITDAPQLKFSMPMKATIVGQEICTVLAMWLRGRRCTLPRNVTGVPSPESAASVSHRSQTTTLARSLSRLIRVGDFVRGPSLAAVGSISA